MSCRMSGEMQQLTCSSSCVGSSCKPLASDRQQAAATACALDCETMCESAQSLALAPTRCTLTKHASEGHRSVDQCHACGTHGACQLATVAGDHLLKQHTHEGLRACQLLHSCTVAHLQHDANEAARQQGCQHRAVHYALDLLLSLLCFCTCGSTKSQCADHQQDVSSNCTHKHLAGLP